MNTEEKLEKEEPVNENSVNDAEKDAASKEPDLLKNDPEASNEAEEKDTKEDKKTREKRGKKLKENKETEKLNIEITKLTEELNTQKDSLFRLAAEYDNYRKRTANEKSALYSDATAKAIEALLPVADSLDSAVSSMGDKVPEEYVKGLDLISQQFAASLEKLGVEAFAKPGDTFNPEIHHAVSQTENKNFEENTLVLVFQKGYKIGDKVIRPAMVQVAN